MNIHRVLAAAALAASLFLGCGGGQAAEEGADASAPPPAEIAALAKRLRAEPSAEPTAGADPAAISATGEFVSPIRSDLVSRVKGRVGAVLVEEGQDVTKGQALLRLETNYFGPELDRAEAALTSARALLSEASADHARKLGLLEKGSAPQAVYDRSRSGYEQAQAAVDAAEATAMLASRQLADAVLYSPIDGVVAERHADVGERLSESTVAYVIVQLVPLRLRFDLPERQLPFVREGQTVRASVAPYPGEVFEGLVLVVGKAIDAASRTFPVEAVFSNQDRRLRPGLFARVELETAVADSAEGADA